jgi:putative component of membrane protein insertase Oxa1/YidC/SpoIIIJ protein YidD
MFSNASLWAITAYQNWISPYKGFRCAYSVLQGGTGCSGYAKWQIKALGLLPALPKIRARFQACRAAMETLQRKRTKANRKRKTEQKRKADKQRPEDGCTCDFPSLPRNCRRPADAFDCNTCDLPCDVCPCG